MRRLAEHHGRFSYLVRSPRARPSNTTVRDLLSDERYVEQLFTQKTTARELKIKQRPHIHLARGVEHIARTDLGGPCVVAGGGGGVAGVAAVAGGSPVGGPKAMTRFLARPCLHQRYVEPASVAAAAAAAICGGVGAGGGCVGSGEVPYCTIQEMPVADTKS